MNWTLVIQLVTVGLSALISYFISNSQKRTDFKYDYRKYILEKRKAAYAEVEKLFVHLSEMVDKSFKIANRSDLGFEPVLAMYYQVYENYGFWISAKLSHKLTILTGVLGGFQDMEPDPEKEKLHRKFWNDDIIKEFQGVRTQYFADIMDLDNIESFKTEKFGQFAYEGELFKRIEKKISEFH